MHLGQLEMSLKCEGWVRAGEGIWALVLELWEKMEAPRESMKKGEHEESEDQRAKDH